LKLFWQQHAHAEAPLKLWFGLAAKGSWSGPAEFGRSLAVPISSLTTALFSILAVTNTGLWFMFPTGSDEC
jgi:mRNA-degrading endonuclease HigB of HigAB toxin-antitoxin module